MERFLKKANSNVVKITHKIVIKISEFNCLIRYWFVEYHDSMNFTLIILGNWGPSIELNSILLKEKVITTKIGKLMDLSHSGNTQFTNDVNSEKPKAWTCLLIKFNLILSHTFKPINTRNGTSLIDKPNI